MDLFPTQYSTLSASALNEFIERRYGFPGLACRFLLHGVSDTYRLENATDKYIFKVYRTTHRSLDEIKGEVELLTILSEQGAKVAYPIRDRYGRKIQEFNAAEGLRHGVLFSFASGTNVYDFTDNQLTIIGREMAFNHTITARIELSYQRKAYDIDTTLLRPLHLLKPAFANNPTGYAELTNLANRVIKKMESFDTDAFSYGYCHYDYLPKNFHFDQDDAFTLFDFDFAGKGFLANDMASFLVHFFFHNYHGKLTKEEGDRQFAVFLAGYRQVKPILDEEIEAIPYFGIMFWLFYLGFAQENFDDWSNSFFGPGYLSQRVALINRFAEQYCRF